MIDTGLKFSQEFEGSSIRWIYAVGSKRSQNDEPIPNSEGQPTTAMYQDGTCVGSKIIGRSRVVVKNAELVVVKTRPNILSFYSAVTSIIENIRLTMGYGSTARGRVVINIRGGYTPDTTQEGVLIAIMKQLFQELAISIQAVVIISAGEKVPGSCSTEMDLYSALFSTGFPLLTVGAVIARASNPQIGQC